MKLKLLFASILSIFLINSINAQCLEITSIFVNSCGPTEGENEMFTFDVGASDLYVNDISVTWPNPSNSFLGWCHNASTATSTAALNATILTSCGWLIEPTNDTLPAGANVIVITSENISLTDNSFEGLADTMYIIYQCAGNTQGHFANSFSGTRTLIVNTTASSCTQTETATYDGSIPNSDGATAIFDYAGNVSYINNGCNAPVITLSAAWSFTDKICNTHAPVDLNTLLSSNATTGGTWIGTNVVGSTYTPNTLGIDSVTYEVTGTGACGETLDSTIVFEVVELQQGTLNLQSCDSLSYSGITYYANTTFITTITTSNPYYCDSSVQVNIVIDDAYIDSAYLSACDSVLYEGNYYKADTTIRDTIFGGGGGSGIDTILHTSFEDSEGWSDQSSASPWTLTDAYGTWSGNGMYANQFSTNTGTRKIGMNDVGDYIQLPPVDNPTTFTYFDELSSAPSSTNAFALEYFDGTSWVEIGRDTCTHTTYEMVSFDVSFLSSLTGVEFRIYRTDDNRSGYIDDITIYGQTSSSSTCDSINIAYIDVLDKDTTYATDTTCNPSLAGVFDTTYTNTNGCDSIHYTNRVFHTDTVLIEAIICSGDTFHPPYTNSYYTAPGSNYWDTVYASPGCVDYILNSTVYVNSRPPDEVSFPEDTVMCAGQTLTLGPIMYVPPAQSLVWDDGSTGNTRTITSDGIYWSNYWAGVIACPHEYDTIQVTFVNPDTTYSSSTSCNPADVGVSVYNGTNIYNCDSTHYDTITLASYSSAAVNITDCDSALANGNWYFANTSFNDTIINGSSNGCDSITTFNVTVNNAVVTTSASTSCNPADVGTNMTGPFTMANGCDSTHYDTVTLLIDTNTVVSNLSNCDSVFYNGIWYTANTTVLDTIFNSQGCDSIYNQVNITILPASSCSNTYTCQFDTVLFDSYEYTTNIPGLIAGATIHSSPRDGTSGTFLNRQHSGDYLFYMNFSNGYSGAVYERIMDVCPGADFRYSFWIRQYDNNVGSDITINIYDGNTTSGTLLYSQNVVNSGTTYNQIVSPQLTAVSNNIVFQLVTNAAGSAGGNDLCFDDLLLEICQIDTIHYSDTIGNMVLCPAANTINLFDSLPNLNTSGTWSGPSTLTNGHLGTFNPAVNTAGLYIYAIPGVSACTDTVYTLNTIILQDSTQTVIDSFCAGTNYLLNGGTIVSAAGNYTDTVGNAVCNTIYTYQLTTYSCLNCTVNLGNDTSFCQGESVSLDAGANFDEYLWSDNSTNQTLDVNASGTYWVQTTIFDTANNLVANGDFSQGNNGFTSDYSYSTSGAVVTCPNGNQSWGIVGCEGTYTVINNPNMGHSNFANCGDHTSGSGNMIVVNGSNTPNMSVWCQDVTVSPNTDYVFSAWAMSVMNVSSNDVATLHFLINGVQIGSDFSPSLTACNWQQFNATWNSGSNTNITICIESDVISGNNDYAIDDIFFTPYCVSSDTVNVTVNPYPVVNLGTDITTCNTSVTLDATTANATYTWQDNSSSATYNVTSSGQYYVDVTVNNCTSSDTINVTLNSATTGQATATICQGDSAFLANEWQTVADVYYDTLINANSCDSILATTLIVENPQISVTDDTQICDGSDITLQASAVDSVFWSTGEEVANITVMPNTTTTYIATVVSNNGCTAQDSVTITVINPINNVSITASDTLIDAGETVTIEASADNVQSYFWEPVNSSSNSIIENPQTTTTYIVTMSNEPCPNVIDSVTIQVNPILVIDPLMPTAFSPNGDNNNDVFRPANFDMFSSYLLRIYNRWGELIYQDEGYGVAWDGLYKAKPQNLDVYSYYIEATPLNTTEVKIASGNLTLIR